MNEQQLRIGDAEREQAAAELGEHYVQGRLTAEEHSERLERVMAARTRADLGPPFRDLPGRYGPPLPTSATAAPAWRSPYSSGSVTPFRRGRPSLLVLVLGVLLALTVITHFPLVLIGGLVLLFVTTRHRGHSHSRNWPRSGC